MSNPFLDRLVRLGDLSRDEQDAVRALCDPVQKVRRGEVIVSDGTQPAFSVALMSGLACRAKALEDGRRQILCFQTPGDGLDLYGYALKRLDHSVIALSDCEISRIPHAKLDAVLARFPRLALTLWRETIYDTSMLREQLVRIGQRPALERTANLFCELAHRLDDTGLCKGDLYLFPVSQTVLAEALGLSPVHTNRVLRQLREDGAMETSRRGFRVLDRARLRALGKFEAIYLELPPLVMRSA